MNEIRQHTYREQSVFARRPVLTGLAVGVATLAPHAFLSPEGSVGFAAVVIALIAGVYFGFEVMNGGELSDEDDLYFAAGIGDELHGLFGEIGAVSEPGTAGLMLLSMAGRFAMRQRRALV